MPVGPVPTGMCRSRARGGIDPRDVVVGLVGDPHRACAERDRARAPADREGLHLADRSRIDLGNVLSPAFATQTEPSPTATAEGLFPTTPMRPGRFVDGSTLTISPTPKANHTCPCPNAAEPAVDRRDHFDRLDDRVDAGIEARVRAEQPVREPDRARSGRHSRRRGLRAGCSAEPCASPDRSSTASCRRGCRPRRTLRRQRPTTAGCRPGSSRSRCSTRDR